MPIIQINMLEGRSDEQKRKLVEKVTDAVVDAIGAPRESVRILIHQLGPCDFAAGGVVAADSGKMPSAPANGRGSRDMREINA